MEEVQLWGDWQALSHWGLGCIVCAKAKEQGLNITSSFATYDVRCMSMMQRVKLVEHQNAMCHKRSLETPHLAVPGIIAPIVRGH